MKIAIFGKIRSGKSTVCEIISEELNTPILDFGDALKECVSIAYPETIGQKKNRSLLIQFGQHLRKMDKDIWVNALKHKVENCNCEDILVTGIRQQNEYDMLKDLGFIFIKVSAPKTTRFNRCLQAGDKFCETNLEDETEILMDSFDFDAFIWNEDISLERLKEVIKNSIRKLKKEELTNE